VSSELKWGGIFGAGLGYVWGRWLNRYISRKLPDAASYPPKNSMAPFLLSLLLGVLQLLANASLRHYL
jgi:fluoride ion exporter CrcB/FEX